MAITVDEAVRLLQANKEKIAAAKALLKAMEGPEAVLCAACVTETTDKIFYDGEKPAVMVKISPPLPQHALETNDPVFTKAWVNGSKDDLRALGVRPTFHVQSMSKEMRTAIQDILTQHEIDGAPFREKPGAKPRMSVVLL